MTVAVALLVLSASVVSLHAQAAPPSAAPSVSSDRMVYASNASGMKLGKIGPGAAAGGIAVPDDGWYLVVRTEGTTTSETLYDKGRERQTLVTQYDAAGTLSRQLLVTDGVPVSDIVYDRAGYPSEEKRFLEDGSTETFRFTYTKGRLVARTTLREGVIVDTRSYLYSPDGRLVSVVRTGDTTSQLAGTAGQSTYDTGKTADAPGGTTGAAGQTAGAATPALGAGGKTGAAAGGTTGTQVTPSMAAGSSLASVGSGRDGLSWRWKTSPTGTVLEGRNGEGRLVLTETWTTEGLASREEKTWTGDTLAAISVTTAGSTTITGYIVSGPATGSILSIEVSRDGKTVSTETRSYDDQGRLSTRTIALALKSVRPATTETVYTYDAADTPATESTFEDGSMTRRILYESAGVRIEEFWDDGAVFARVRYEDGRRVLEEIVQNGVVVRTRKFD